MAFWITCQDPAHNKEMQMKTTQTIWTLVCVGACVAVLAATPAWAQPGGGGRGGAVFGGGFGGGDLAGLLRREDVQKELELLDDQIEQLQKLAEGQREKMREAFQGTQDLSREERMQKFQELMQKNREDQDKEIAGVLLPHQMKRLKQIQFQMRSRGGIGRAAGNEELAKELGITDAQKEKLQAKAQELEEEIRQQLNELREKAQNELLSILTPTQQAKWKEMAGEPFEMEMQRPQPGAANGGQRGNFGGQRGNFGGQRGNFGGQRGNGGGQQGRRPN